MRETLEKEVGFLERAVAFYQSERNYFQALACEIRPEIQISPRPASPNFLRREAHPQESEAIERSLERPCGKRR